MSLDTKIEAIKNEKESAVLALTLYLDSIYNMTDKFFDCKTEKNEKGEEVVVRTLKEGLTKDEKLEGFIKELNNDCSAYEKVREKIQNGDFNLSLQETARVGLAFTYAAAVIQKDIEKNQKGLEQITKIMKTLMKDTQEVDFSKE